MKPAPDTEESERNMIHIVFAVDLILSGTVVLQKVPIDGEDTELPFLIYSRPGL